MSWLQRWVAVLGSRTQPIAPMPSSEQRILRLLERETLTAREVAERCRVPLGEVYGILGSLYERRAVATHPSGYFWIGEDRLDGSELWQRRGVIEGDRMETALSA